MKAKKVQRSTRVASNDGLEVCDDEVPDGYWGRLVAWMECAPTLEVDGGELAALAEREERLRLAIEWALGVRGEFKERSEDEGKYWWRTELCIRAGLKWDGEKFIDV